MTAATTDMATKAPTGTGPATKRVLLPAVDACQGTIFNSLQQLEETGQTVGRRNAGATRARRLGQLRCGIGYFFAAR